jgi:uncharacterized protein YfaS (alpha-2-macroglobulin family)
MKAAKTDAAQQAEVLRLIGAAARHRGDSAVIPDDAKDPSYHMGSDMRATAVTLAALLEVAPSDPLVQPLLRGLDAGRDLSGRWGNTQDNLWALVAFADYARLAAPGRSTVTILSGGRTLATERLDGGGASVVRIPLSSVDSDLSVKTTGGVAHFRARLTEVAKDSGAAISSGFTVTREYLRKDGTPAVSFASGDLVTVRLTVVNPTARRWVAMVDPLPAGFEPVNPRLAASGSGGSSHSWMWTHHELRDDQVRWFADWVSAGTMVMTYQARATTDGTFLAGPALIEAMYEPTTMGRTASSLLTVRP